MSTFLLILIGIVIGAIATFGLVAYLLRNMGPRF